MITKKEVLNLIKKNLIESIGCTEPVAIGLCTSTAFNQIKGKIKSIDITLDTNVYKNAFFITIPGTDQKGIKFAIVLATINTDPKKGLLLFEKVTKKDIQKAKAFNLDLIKIHHNPQASSIYIKVKITTNKGSATCLIENFHDNITEITKNGKIIFSASKKSLKQKKNIIPSITLKNMINIIKKIPENELSFLNNYLKINLKAAKKALSQKNNIGLDLKKILNKDSIVDKIKYHVAAASSARMSGKQISIIACAGSGNQSLTFFITVGLAYKYLKPTKYSLTKALAFGILILLSIKKATGLLTPMCGCAIAAATAAAGALTFGFTGDEKQILSAINLVLVSLAGLICDGAKASCALKVATSASVAVESALLAKQGLILCPEGIIADSFLSTIKNLASLHKKGMKKMDETILNIISPKALKT